jgi:hypothetical protein
VDEGLETESELEKQIGLFFLNYGIFCQKTPKLKTYGKRRMSGPLNLNGSPDLYIIHRGRFIALEVKKPGQRLSEAQELFHGLLRKAGANCYVVRSLEECYVILKVLKEL